MPSSARFIGAAIIDIATGSRVEIGERVRLVSDSRRTALGVSHPVVIRTLSAKAQILIGDDAGISGGSICAVNKVQIGAGSMLGADVTVTDTDFHPLDHVWRRYEPTPAGDSEDAVILGLNVFVGTGAIILKGTVLGDHCVVGAGSVVKGRFPAGTVLAGNPAKALRVLAVGEPG